jgi:hypothetical protein
MVEFCIFGLKNDKKCRILNSCEWSNFLELDLVMWKFRIFNSTVGFCKFHDDREFKLTIKKFTFKNPELIFFQINIDKFKIASNFTF